MHSPVQLNSSPMNPSGSVVASLSVSIYTEQTCGTHWSLESLHTYTYKAKADANVSCAEKTSANNQHSYVKIVIHTRSLSDKKSVDARSHRETLVKVYGGRTTCTNFKVTTCSSQNNQFEKNLKLHNVYVFMVEAMS